MTTAGSRLPRRAAKRRSAVTEGTVYEPDSWPPAMSVPKAVCPMSVKSETVTMGNRNPRKLLPKDGSGSLESFRRRSVQMPNLPHLGFGLGNTSVANSRCAVVCDGRTSARQIKVAHPICAPDDSATPRRHSRKASATTVGFCVLVVNHERDGSP